MDMARTTLNIDNTVLRDLKRLQRKEGKPLGRLASDLLAWAMGELRNRRPEKPEFRWASRAMGVRIDLSDKDTLWPVLDQDD